MNDKRGHTTKDRVIVDGDISNCFIQNHTRGVGIRGRNIWGHLSGATWSRCCAGGILSVGALDV
jgi:hypothetical protein